MRRFILVDAFAAEELVSTRTLQSDDFENGRILGAALTGALCLGQLAPKAYLVEAGQGLYILNRPLKKCSSNAPGSWISKKRVVQTRLRSECEGHFGLFAGRFARFGRTYPMAHA